MFAPAATGFGAGVLPRLNRTLDRTVVVSAAPFTGPASFEVML